MKTERERQYEAARGRPFESCYHYACEDGETFHAIAPTENAAFRVLEAERPGIIARFVGVSTRRVFLAVTTLVALAAPSAAHAHTGPAHVHGDEPRFLVALAAFAAVAAAVAVLRRAKKEVRS